MENNSFRECIVNLMYKSKKVQEIPREKIENAQLQEKAIISEMIPPL